MANSTGWGSWAQNCAEGTYFSSQMLNEADTAEEQLYTYEEEFKNNQISATVYMQDVVALNNQVSQAQAAIAAKCPDVMSDAGISGVMTSFNSAWTAAMAGSGLQLPNPVGFNPNGPTPMLNETINSDGTVTVTFNVTYYHNGPFSEYNIGLNCACHNDSSSLGWMPADGDTDAGGNAWANVLSDVDSHGGTGTFNWNCLPNGQTIDFTVTGGGGSFTISATMPASAAINCAGITQNNSGLNNFEKSLM